MIWAIINLAWHVQVNGRVVLACYDCQAFIYPEFLRRGTFHPANVEAVLRFSGMDVWYNVAKSVVRAYLTLFIRGIYLEGGENLPRGPKIIVANHPHASDAFVLPFIFKEKLHFFIQEDSFRVPIIGRLLTLADQIPVVLGRGREALNLAREKLAIGNSIVIFPEGRLNNDRLNLRAHTGAMILAVESGAPLVPVGFFVPPSHVRTIVTQRHQRERIGAWQFGGRCFVRIGEPWYPSLAAGAERNYRALLEMSERMMARIQELAQQAANAALISGKP